MSNQAAKRAIVITGCQRSGTTLLNLILDSHPEVIGVDEDEFDQRLLPTYLNGAATGQAVSFKLPDQAGNLPFLKSLPHMKAIWCLRDPRAVVASMVRLHLPIRDGTRKLPWAAHPRGARHAIWQTLFLVADRVQADLKPFTQSYFDMAAKPPEHRSRTENVLAGALCWRLKNELPAVYSAHGIPYQVLRYETLIGNPRAELERVMRFVGVEWHGDLLRHDELHSGVRMGDTRADRPIDADSVERWREELDADDLALIADICGTRARAFGIDL